MGPISHILTKYVTNADWGNVDGIDAMVYYWKQVVSKLFVDFGLEGVEVAPGG